MELFCLHVAWLCHFSKMQTLYAKVDFGLLHQTVLLSNLCSTYLCVFGEVNTQYNVLLTQVLSLVPLLFGPAAQTVGAFVLVMYIFYCLLLVAPYNVNIMGVTMYPQEEQLMLSCSSEGGPELEYRWTFSGSEISTNQTLTIDNVNASNGGDYTCNVTNDAGYDSDTITVYSEFVYVYELLGMYMHALHVYDI